MDMAAEAGWAAALATLVLAIMTGWLAYATSAEGRRQRRLERLQQASLQLRRSMTYAAELPHVQKTRIAFGIENATNVEWPAARVKRAFAEAHGDALVWLMPLKEARTLPIDRLDEAAREVMDAHWGGGMNLSDDDDRGAPSSSPTGT